MNRLAKAGLIGLLVIILLATGLRFFGSELLERIVAERLQPMLNANPHRLYELGAANLTIEAWSGELSLDSIFITPRPYALDSLAANEIEKHNIISARIERLSIRGLHIFQFLIDRKLRIQKIELFRPDVTIYSDPRVKEESRQLALDDIFSDQFKALRLRQLDISEANIRLMDVSQDSLEKVRIDTMHLLLEKVHLDKKAFASLQPLPLDHIRTEIDRFSLVIGAKTIMAESVMIDERKDVGKLSLQNFSFGPTDQEAIDPRRSRIKASLKGLEMEGFEIDSAYHKGKILVKKIRFNEPVLDVVLDQHYPKPRGARPLLGTIIREVPFPFAIDSVQIRQGKINYTLIPLQKRPGHLSLTSLDARAGNFTNDSLRLAENSHATLLATTKLYDQASLNLAVDLPLTDLRDHMDIDIAGSGLNLTSLNAFAQPAYGAKIESGIVQKIHAKYWINRDTSLGDLVMIYDDLKVGLIAKKDRRKTDKFLSFLANNVVRSHNTPDRTGYRIGNITRHRDPNDDVVRHMWESVFNGIVSVAVPIVAKKGQKAEVLGKQN